jgi:hypothetical protein
MTRKAIISQFEEVLKKEITALGAALHSEVEVMITVREKRKAPWSRAYAYYGVPYSPPKRGSRRGS